MPANRLVNANYAPRCEHLKTNGSRCGSPARHGRPFCCFHDSAARRNRDFVLPIIEDHASLQLALNKIMQALLDKLIDQKTAATLFYGLQIAFANLKQLKHEQLLDKYHRRRQQREAYAQAQAAEAEDKGENEEYEDDEEERQQAQDADAPADIRAFGDAFIRDFFNRPSQIPNHKSGDDQPTRGTFDIDACAPLRPRAIGSAFGNRQSEIDNAVNSDRPITRSPDHPITFAGRVP